jgi:DNA-binding SARP family transcriptional activator/predicted ATPase
MARLSVRLLGPPQIALDAEPITGFASDKVRALLAYLVLETEQPHRREKLAGLLWPDRPEQSARASLRQALVNLRQVTGDRHAAPPYFHISRQTIQFNRASNAWIDVTAFTDLLQAKALSQQTIRQLEQAVELYRGDLMEGFSVSDSSAFEEWALLNRERLHRLVMDALHRLAQVHEAYGDLEQALPHAWRQVELDPWRENAHRQLMRLLALSGQRGAALAQYETCRRLLAEELGVEPAAETTRLYEQIRDGELKAPVPSPARPLEPAAKPPPFLDEEKQVKVEVPVFVAREPELGQLGVFLDLALAGEGQVVFVTGEAGSGKTALTQEFARRALEAHAGLLVANGNCNAYTGLGDPYLPFREILGLLTGDVEARWAAGAITREHARRLWNGLPIAAQALVEAGPDLIDTFVPGTDLVQRAMAYGCGMDWLTRLDELVERTAPSPGAPSLQQSDLFEQYTGVLEILARQGPLMLVVDDLQWADAGSVSLLFHLGRNLAGSRILIVGAYRPEEVALGRNGERHPLEAVVNEFQRRSGDITVNLGKAESRDFVEAFLNTEPNRLGVAFREMLHQQTRGHPLFTVELLRGMQQRGDLVQDHEGRWVTGPGLDWETLPPRVEAVIAERIGRLAEPLQAAVRVASVEGEVFTAEVVARVQAADEWEMVSRLSSELDRRHRLLRAQGFQRIDDQRLSHYRFRHILFQKYLYNSLDRVERAHLHEAVGDTLETLYEQQVEGMAAIAGQLAWHYQEAGMAAKAIGYLRQAGDRAVRLSANEEAIAHLTQGLALLETLADTPERAQQELALQLALAMPLLATRGYAAPELSRTYARARELCQQMGETPQLFPALLLLWMFYATRAEHQTALELGEQILSLAQRLQDPLQVAFSNWAPGLSLLYLGEFTLARAHFEQMIAFYDPQQHRSLAFLYGQDPGVTCLSWAAWSLWFLGHPDQALKRSREALALAQELDHPFTLVFALGIAGSLFHHLRGAGQAVQEYVDASIRLSTEERFALFQAGGIIFRGWVQTEAGKVEEGIAEIRQGLATWQAMGAGMHLTHYLGMLAEAHAGAGQSEEGLSVLAEALSQVEETGERYYEAEIHRLKGELLLMQRDEAEAEASFQHAIEVARRQRARSWELRATTSLARLWQAQGKGSAARKALAEIFGWFTEGFDTPDLREARALLEELEGS